MTETTETASPPGAGAPPAKVPEQATLDPRRWLALCSVMTALFMVLLDVSIVNVAIRAIRSNLAAKNADIQFVIAGYGLAYAVLLITGGRLGDIFGRKRMFMRGMSGFVVASALCGLAQSAIMLDLSRVLQGAMAALMYPQVFSVIQVTFPPQERARVFGFLGAVIGIATITGPLVGGLIIRDDLPGGSCGWLSLVNLPIGIGALVAASRLVTESRAPNATRLDLVGVVLATAGILLLVYPLVEGQVGGLAPLDVHLHGHQSGDASPLHPLRAFAAVDPVPACATIDVPHSIVSRWRRHRRRLHRGHPSVLLHLQPDVAGRTRLQCAPRRPDHDSVEHRLGVRVCHVRAGRTASRQVDDRHRLVVARGRGSWSHAPPSPLRHTPLHTR